jgi:hypothetical protein
LAGRIILPVRRLLEKPPQHAGPGIETLDVECGGAAAQAIGSLHQIGGSGRVGISDTVSPTFPL